MFYFKRDFIFLGLSYLWMGLQSVAAPNILILLTDDQGYADLGCQGSKEAVTPHIDSLAQGGVRFTQGYVSSCMCSPSRAGLLIGRSQSHFGHETNWEDVIDDGKHGIPLSEKTLADRLRVYGYHTGAVGKWHLGDSAIFHPLKRGFDEFFGFTHGGHDYYCEKYRADAYNPKKRYSQYTTLLEENGKTLEAKGYLTDVLGQACCQFIQKNKSQPWLLYAAFNAPHTPLQAKQEMLERFAGVVDKDRRTYLAMLASVDEAVGQILETLKKEGILEQTLIFYLSDNGGALKRNGSSNEPLRGEKGGFFEGGIRVPFIMQWPEKIKGGQVSDLAVSSLDIAATALVANGLNIKQDVQLDGIDLVEYLESGSSAKARDLFWRMKERNIWAIRSGFYKLVKQGTANPQLFDLSQDSAEKNDLSSSEPKLVQSMLEKYNAWEKQLSEPLWRIEEN
jgi:arylsulfatase A-like enzyme